jgi:hypothetical protein
LKKGPIVDKNAFLIDLSESDNTDVGKRDFSSQSEVQKVFSAIWALESEVNNGGFHQYFLNFDGNTANFAPDALRRIGAVSCADIVERALRVVSPEPLPDDENARQILLDCLGDDVIEQLGAIDSEFYSYPDNLTSLLFDFVHAHPNEFGPTPA